ncbi:MAG: hypothetical protein JWP10_532 [Nocardioidaceae bacterium]|nr:hypothetical protein [Nocardioidaceae bacterium]
MRSPIVHVAKDGSVTYRVRFRVKNVQTSETFDSGDAAEEFCKLLDALGPKSALEYINLREGLKKVTTPTLDEWAAQYIEHLTGITDGTRGGYERLYARTWGRLIGTMPLDSIDHDAVARSINELSNGGKKRKGYSDKSVANQHGLLAAMLDAAVLKGIIDASPCKGIRLPRRTEHEKTENMFLTVQEFAALRTSVDDRFRPLVDFLAGSGCRYGEAEAVQVRDFNFKASTVRINKAAKWDSTKSLREIGPTKTKKSNRTITLPAEIVAELEEHARGRRPTGFMFTMPHGGQLRHRTVTSRYWVPACERAGLMTPRPRIHDLRHSHASWLISAGVPLPVIQRRLGHESITTTVDLYGHLLPDVQLAAAAAANEVFAALPLGLPASAA